MYSCAWRIKNDENIVLVLVGIASVPDCLSRHNYTYVLNKLTDDLEVRELRDRIDLRRDFLRGMVFGAIHF